MFIKNLSYLMDFRIWITIMSSMGLGFALMAISPFFDKKPLLLLAWPLSALFFILMVTQPKWVAVLILIFRPLLDVVLNMTKVGGSGGVGIGAVINLAVILLTVFLAFFTFNFPRKIMPVHLWITFLILMICSAFYSPYPKEGLRLCFNYLSYFALFIIPFLLIKSQEDFIFWLKILGISFVLPILYANIDMLKGGHYFEDAGNRIMGTFTHPNILAFYLVLAFTFYFYLLRAGYLEGRPWASFSIKILMLNILVLLVATKTRNAWLAIYAGFFIYGILKERKILLFLVLMVPLALSVPQVSQRIVNVFTGETENNYKGVNSFEWRLQLWTGSLVKVAERPLQGFGLASFQPSTEKLFSGGSKGMHAHNSYLEFLFETGLIGLSSYLAIFIAPLLIFFRNMRRAINEHESRVWGLMVAYLVIYMLISAADNLSFYLTFNWYVWFLIGLMLVASYKRYSVSAHSHVIPEVGDFKN